MGTWWQILSRRKHIGRPSSNKDETKSTSQDGSPGLARVLTTIDLTALGVGSTLGVGVYVLAGHVARDIAGPSVVLSFLIAAIASVFAGLCYAEFGARVPKAGSAYIYSYATIGEFIAFIIGWNLILEYVIGSASVAKGLSIYLDSLLNNTMKTTFLEIAPVHSDFLSNYFDFFSFGITLILGAALAFGLKESSLANNIFTFINILVVIFVIIAGSILANPINWSITNSTIPSGMNGGSGGFFPFGIAGTIKGAATCFYGFVGFDCIATTGEEVKNPKRAIPISIISSLFIIFLAYFGTSAVVTLMLPYYLQDPEAPIPHAFEANGWIWAKWIVSIGGIFGLCASLFGAMFPLPRIIYAMANDALVFRFLGSVNTKFRTPVAGTLLAALLTGLMSALFNLKQLVNMMSIGTLLAYTIVAACVIILRYSVNEDESIECRYALLQPSLDSHDEYSSEDHIYEDDTENLNLIQSERDITLGKISKQIFNFSKTDPTYLSQKLITILVFIFCILCLILAMLLSFLQTNLENGDLVVIIPTGIVVILILATLLMIWGQPTSNAKLSFKVPLVPFIPALSICINIYLMMMLDSNTWIRFAIWMAIGFPIYVMSCFFYKKPTKTLTLPKNTANGHTRENGKSTNGLTLTIPEIVVDSPKTEEIQTEVDVEKSETKNYVRKRTLSIDSTDLNNAVLEIDKVLNETEIDDVAADNFEAINPENEYKNSAILSKQIDDTFEEFKFIDIDKVSIYSSDSESDHSREHHVQAEVHQEDSDEAIEIKKDPEVEEISNIPVPPPLPIYDNSPKKIFINDFSGIKLKPLPQSAQISEVTTTNNQPPTTDNVKPGSEDYNNIKDKLNNLFKNRPQLKVPEKRHIIEDKSPSPNIETLYLIDDVLAQYDEEIPEDFGKTKEFKDSLNNLLMRKHSKESIKSEYTRKYEKNNENVTKSTKKDEINHKNLMAETLRSIGSLKSITKIVEDSEEQKIEVKEDNKTIAPITDKEEHKKLMLSTLRSIKQRAELPLTEEERRESREEMEMITKNSPQIETVKVNDKENHENLMLATLRSIKQKAELPLTEEERRESREEMEMITKNAPKVNDKENHKNLMLATLRSIKQRAELPLTEEERRESREEMEMITKKSPQTETVKVNDKENHKKLMLATLRSIKLRKTGLLPTDEEIL